jgi:thioredoxin
MLALSNSLVLNCRFNGCTLRICLLERYQLVVQTMATQSLKQLNEADFEREVLKSEVPTVVVDFFADWCGPCRAVGPVIESLSREYAGRAKFVKVNVDDNQNLASQYDVQSIPTVAIFKGGQLLDRVTGAAPAQLYRSKVDAGLNHGRRE